MEFCHFQDIYPKTWKRIIGYRTRFFTNCFQKLVYKIAEFIGNKIADVIAKQSDYIIVKTKPVEEIIIPPEKKERKY